MPRYLVILLGLFAGAVAAQVPAVLLEACNALEPASKRLECLRAANQNAALGAPIAAPQSVYRPPAQTAPANTYNFAPTPSANYSAPSGKTCYTGPRGGTYTITKSGKKNYGGC
jgi:hypothetical protein